MDAYALQLLNYVIRPTLHHLGIADAETKAWLLLGTATVATASSAVRPYAKHFGIYTITHADHVRIWDEFLANDADLASTVRGLASQHRFLQQPDEELNTNLAYATAIAAMFYEESISTWPHTAEPACLGSLWARGFWPHMDRDAAEFSRLLTPLQQPSVRAAA
ncbi:MAG: hypothetical protein ACR2P1_09365 [Pseudomonadales bacterium]